MKNRFLIYFIILTLCMTLGGCAALQKKFSRKKKEQEKIAPIITTYDYSKELKIDELYKKYFLFWKSWQSELIDRIDSTYYKKRISCYDYTISSLMDMRRYLTGSKAIELDGVMKEIGTLDPQIRERSLSKSELYRIRQLLRRTKRQIDKGFSYSKVKEFLEDGNDD